MGDSLGTPHVTDKIKIEMILLTPKLRIMHGDIALAFKTMERKLTHHWDQILRHFELHTPAIQQLSSHYAGTYNLLMTGRVA